MINNIRFDQNVSQPNKQPNHVRTILQSKPDEVHFQTKQNVSFNGGLFDIKAKGVEFFQKLTGKKAPEVVEQKPVEAPPELLQERIPVDRLITEKCAEIQQCGENDDYDGLFDAKIIVLDLIKPEHIEIAVPLLDKENPARVRTAGVQIITEGGTPEQVQKYISPLLRDPDPEVKQDALICIGQKASRNDLKTMIEILDSDEPDDQALVIEAREAVIYLAKKDDDLKHETIKMLDPFLKANDYNRNSIAMSIIGGIGNTEDVPLVQPFLENQNSMLKQDAIKAIGNIGTKEQKEELITPLTKDRDWLVRYTARQVFHMPPERGHIAFETDSAGGVRVVRKQEN